MTFTDAAQEVLTQEGRPLHYKEITELAIEKNLLSHVGKSPEVTMGARLAATLKKGGDDNPLIRVKPGVFALRDWDEETIKLGLKIKRAPAKKKKEDDEAETKSKRKDGEDDSAKSAKKDTKTTKAEVDDEPQTPEEARRAEIAASVSEVFADEDDDDEPLLGDDDKDEERGAKRRAKSDEDDDDRDEDKAGRGKRRRRRRRRGRSNKDDNKDDGTLPTYTATPVDGDKGGRRGPQVIDLGSADTPALDGLAGASLADVVATILSTFDRTVGAVSLRQITETAQRNGKLQGDQQMAQAQIAAAVRADNARRESVGLRPRFRMAGGRVGLTDWLLDNELSRYERELMQALGRYREASRRAFARKASELPGHAFVELCMMVLERSRVQQIRPVKFPGASGAEAHFSGVLHTPASAVAGQIGEGQGIRLGIVIRKDGRDLGRERVTELRGSVHHYDGATAGWLFTSGQILSGAREEAGLDHTMPVTMLDGVAIARLCDELGVAVLRSVHPVSLPDVDLFEALRSS
ncbi:MAG TPA: hypothetical protein ENK57_08075 [Polyangiaceae bacterium]|nr:hypothetical protein [Polyangiaceae bacterium]